MINLIIKNSEESVISLDILKSHLRIANSCEDNYLKNIINTATEILENNIELSLLYKTYKCIINNYNIKCTITLPIKNIKTIENIKDSKNNYIDFNVNNKNELQLSNNNNFPITIEYIAGFTNSIEEIPKDMKLAILQIAKNIYDNNEENILNSNYIQEVINKYKQLNL